MATSVQSSTISTTGESTAISTGAQHWQVYLEHDTNTEGVGVRSYTEIAPEFVERSDADDDVEDVEEATEVALILLSIFSKPLLSESALPPNILSKKRNLITWLIWRFTTNHDEPPPEDYEYESLIREVTATAPKRRHPI